FFEYVSEPVACVLQFGFRCGVLHLGIDGDNGFCVTIRVRNKPAMQVGIPMPLGGKSCRRKGSSNGPSAPARRSIPSCGWAFFLPRMSLAAFRGAWARNRRGRPVDIGG